MKIQKFDLIMAIFWQHYSFWLWSFLPKAKIVDFFLMASLWAYKNVSYVFKNWHHFMQILNFVCHAKAEFK